MATADDIDANIAANLANPKSMSNDGHTVVSRDLSDQVAGAKYLREQAAMDDPNAWPLKSFKIMPPGGR